jgi:hypothetical protein
MLGQKICPTVEAMKTWSQNMGHESVSTTLTSYGPVSSQRRTEIMRSFGQTETKPADVIAELQAVFAKHQRGFSA